ncbi:MAG: long-chain fatty acid--CoA ligase [Pseudomonadota bacterium]
MFGQMQEWPLRVGRILDHAARYHPDRPVISRLTYGAEDGAIVRITWQALRVRTLRLTQALRRLGIVPGTVVGGMAWNTARHLEAWYAVPGAGAVFHTLNPRLGHAQLTYIADHAGDEWIVLDGDLAPVIAGLVPDLPKLRGLIVLGDTVPEALAGLSLPVHTAEALIAAEDGDTAWEPVDERAACGICYTSGTTGRPKGVVYSHRSNVLHAMAMIQPDMLGLSSMDTIMPVVPLFHANGWTTAYSSPMAGAAMAMPGRRLDPVSLCEMLDQGVTISAAVPTVWLPLLAHLRETGRGLPTLERVVIGGSSCPRAVIEAFQDLYGVRVLHAWGMTEISPLGSVCSEKPEVAAMPAERRLDMQETVGHPAFTVDFRIVDDTGAELPRDGVSQGRLQVRGPGVVQRYLAEESDATDAEGWFDTGDAATLDPLGYARITDRFKDVIKSGGEWISSIDLENAAVGHPDVAEAAAVAVPHPKWDERPVLLVVPRPGVSPDPAAIVAHLAPRFAKWQLPDDVVTVESLPHTATGKLSKRHIREMLLEQGYVLPDLRAAGETAGE